MKILFLPKDPNDERSVLLEIRAGTGGDEAALFAADLFRMYARYAEISGWKVEIISSSSAGGMGGFERGDSPHRGERRFQAFEVRERRPSCAAGPCY